MKGVDQYKRILAKMRNTILKLNENINQNKGRSNQFLNENEWIQCSYFLELKVTLCIDNLYLDTVYLIQ